MAKNLEFENLGEGGGIHLLQVGEPSQIEIASVVRWYLLIIRINGAHKWIER